jgi:hypothetical protein
MVKAKIMSKVTRCDEDGVPYIVQLFSFNPYLEIYKVYLFDGREICICCFNVFEEYSIGSTWRFKMLKHEHFDLLEKYINKHLAFFF